MAEVVDVVPVLLGKIHEQLVELNVRNERLDTGQQRQTEVLVKLEAGQRLHTEQLAELNRRVERLDRRTERVEQGQQHLIAGQKELNGRVGRLDGQLGELVRIVGDDVVTKIVDLQRRMDVVEDTLRIG